MANKAEFEMVFKVQDDGSLVLVEKRLNNAGKATKNLGTTQAAAAKHAKEHEKVMNDGVRGTANSTKSFSKLAETINGGGGGLVGAYATLAANIFAVSAAFNALRSAQQSELVLKGLEAQGARTGKSLTVASERLREVLNFGISASESMAATALFSSTGFNSDELEQLGNVAKNASLALGRNLPDSLDRLIKGTAKLEPELLDELGIMTKLGDATALYALQNNKTTNSLTAFEKRQAFLNAVLAEGELKFEGISDKVDTNPYDKLGASFDNLTKNILNWLNSTGGLSSVINFLANSTLGLVGAILLFASTIQKNLLGSLSNLSAKTLESAQASRAKAAELSNELKIQLENTKAKISDSLAQQRNLEINAKSAKVIRESSQAIKEGTLSQAGYERAIAASTRSIAAHNSLLTKAQKIPGADTSNREKIIFELEQEKVALQKLMAAELQHASKVIPLETRAIQLRTSSLSASRVARAQDAAAAAIQAASERNLTTFIAKTIIAISQYIGSLRVVTAAKREAAVAGGILSTVTFRLNQVFSIMKLGAFTAGIGIKALTGAILGLIGTIGIITLVIGAVIAAFTFIRDKLFPETSKATKALDQSLEALAETTKNHKEALAERNRMLTQSNAIGTRVLSAYANEAAAQGELAESIRKTAESYKELERAKLRDAQSSTSTNIQRTVSEELLPTTSFKSVGAAGTFGIFGSDESKGVTQSIDAIASSIGKDKLVKSIELATGSIKKFDLLTPAKQMDVLGNIMQDTAKSSVRLASAVETLKSALDLGGTAAANFFKEAIPSTPFDDLVTSFQGITTSIAQLKREGKGSSELLEIFTSMSDSQKRFLPVNTRDDLDYAQKQFLIISQTAGKTAEEIGRLGMTEQLAQAKQYQSTSAQTLKSVEAAVKAKQFELEKAQQVAALSKSQAALESARFSKYGEFLKNNAAGFIAEQKSKESINALNTEGLKIQKAMIDGDIAREQRKIRELEDQQRINLAKLEALEIDKRATLEAIRYQDIKYSASVPEFLRLPASAQTAEQKKQEVLAIAKKEIDQEILDTADNIDKIKKSITLSELASKALANSIAAANATNLTTEQKLAKVNILNLEEAKRLRQDTLKLSDAELETKIASIKLDAARAGNVQERTTLDSGKPSVRSSAATDVEVLALQAENERKKIQADSSELVKDLKAKAAEYRAFAATATAAEAKSMQQYADELIKRAGNEELISDEKLKQNDAQYRLNLLNKIGLSSDEARLKAQQDINSTLLQALNAAQELNTLKFDNMTKLRTGFASMVGLSELPGEAIKVAQQKLMQEKETRALREQSINLEFALLKAQRQFRIEELRATAAKLTAPEDQGTRQAAIELANQMSESLVVLDKTNADKIASIGQAIENSELDVKMAKTKEFTDILLENFKKLGPDGEAAGALFSGMMQMTSIVETAFDNMKTAGGDVTQQIGAIAGAAAQAIGAVIAMTTAISNAKIASIDKEIAAEEKRDGKSAASVEKLKALDAKKEASAKKAFNTNKKLMMAQAVMSTAAGIANALATPAPFPIPAIMAGIIGAMGAAQLAVIAGTSYESAATPRAVSAPSTLSVGKRSDTVDLAKGPSASAGGEVGYLRGSAGTGSNASNYRTIGSAYGGELMRGYGSRGFVVGEKGPEVINPETPISVTPANDTQGAAPLSATFNIQALDSSDVQRVLVEQKGNIITMLRQAANASGKTFMEDVNVNVYTRSNVGKL